MNTTSYRILRLGVAAAVVFVASCAFQSSPRQVEASNPTVTYKYHSDDELIQTNQLAAEFCSRYQSVPRAVSFMSDADRDNVVVYECVSTLGAATSFNPNRTYTYRTDRELVSGSQNAQAYCLNNGASQVVSTIERNGDGTRTVTFQCRRS